MLTKEERAKIVERANKSLNKGGSLYEILFGCVDPDNTTTECDNRAIVNRVIDLCDTSNMVELPLDKDGEVIHIGDTVTNGAEGRICKVSGYDFKSDGCSVLLKGDGVHGWTYSRPDVLTHKEPATIESLIERFKHVLAKGHMSAWSLAELLDIVNQLESLGDSDD